MENRKQTNRDDRVATGVNIFAPPNICINLYNFEIGITLVWAKLLIISNMCDNKSSTDVSIMY